MTNYSFDLSYPHILNFDSITFQTFNQVNEKIIMSSSGSTKKPL